MPIRTTVRALLAGLAIILFTAPAAFAENVLAVVDVQRLLSESKAAQSVQNQVDDHRKKFLAEIDASEKDLRATQKKLEEESKTLPKEELVKKGQEFEAKRFEARRLLQERKSSLDKAYTEAMSTLSKAITKATEGIAASKKIDLVLTKQNVIVGTKSLDITDDVMGELNSEIKEIKLSVKKTG
jgi:Skp family chaperone for outer membrane proteins